MAAEKGAAAEAERDEGTALDISRAEIARLSAALAAAEARIAHLTDLCDQDPLLPLLNRRALLREAARFAALAERYAFQAALLYIDLDGLKAINDSQGHAAGDAALRHIADLLLGNTRASDLVGRLGGDEFAVLLAQTDEATAARKGAQLSEQAARQPLDWKGRPIPVPIACGAAGLKGPKDLLSALDAADRAMYRQKALERGTGPL